MPHEVNSMSARCGIDDTFQVKFFNAKGERKLAAAFFFLQALTIAPTGETFSPWATLSPQLLLIAIASWRQANRYGVPRMAFINKLDREGADFQRVFDEIKERLEAHPIALQMPVGMGPAHIEDPFRGVIDLIKMKMVTFEDEGKTAKESAIPEELKDEAEFARSNMIEELAFFDDELGELAMEEGSKISNELIRSVIRKATLSREIQPVVCGSALHGMGVQGVLDGVKHYLPSPLDRPPVEGTNPRKEEELLSRKPDPKEPFCGLVFKILPAKTGDTYWVRVYSGELTSNSRLYCPGKDKKENIAQLWQIHATKKDRDGQVPSVSTGEIVGIIGPRFAVTGDTLCDQKNPILLEAIEFPETVIEMAIEPESTSDRTKLADILELLKRQDPTFKANENPDTGQATIEFEKGAASSQIQTLDGQLVSFEVNSPKLQNWFEGPDSTVIYEDLGSLFLRRFMQEDNQQVAKMCHLPCGTKSKNRP